MNETKQLPIFLAVWPTRSQKLQRLLKLSMISWPLVLCSCTSLVPVVAQCPVIPPLPAAITPEPATLTQELLKLLSPLQNEAMPPSKN